MTMFKRCFWTLKPRRFGTLGRMESDPGNETNKPTAAHWQQFLGQYLTQLPKQLVLLLSDSSALKVKCEPNLSTGSSHKSG